MPVLRLAHLLVGVATLIVFLATGQFMDRRLDHLVGMADAPRALYRSAHIYILFSALVNLALGTYLTPSPRHVGRALQYVGSGLLLIAPGLFVYGFFVETPPALVERPMVRRAIEWSLAGILLHAASLAWSTSRGGTGWRPRADGGTPDDDMIDPSAGDELHRDLLE